MLLDFKSDENYLYKKSTATFFSTGCTKWKYCTKFKQHSICMSHHDSQTNSAVVSVILLLYNRPIVMNCSKTQQLRFQTQCLLKG